MYCALLWCIALLLCKVPPLHRYFNLMNHHERAMRTVDSQENPWSCFAFVMTIRFFDSLSATWEVLESIGVGRKIFVSLENVEWMRIFKSWVSENDWSLKAFATLQNPTLPVFVLLPVQRVWICCFYVIWLIGLRAERSGGPIVWRNRKFFCRVCLFVTNFASR